jgi:hypothetical protein
MIGVGAVTVAEMGRNRGRSRDGCWKEWCRGRYSSGNGYDSRAVKEGSSSVPSCTMHIGNGTEMSSNKGGKEGKQEEKHTRGRNVMPTEMEARIWVTSGQRSKRYIGYAKHEADGRARSNRGRVTEDERNSSGNAINDVHWACKGY